MAGARGPPHSKNRITGETLQLLRRLGEEAGLREALIRRYRALKRT